MAGGGAVRLVHAERARSTFLDRARQGVTEELSALMALRLWWKGPQHAPTSTRDSEPENASGPIYNRGSVGFTLRLRTGHYR